MKQIQWFVVALVTVTSLPLSAQMVSVTSQAGASANASAAGIHTSGSTNADANGRVRSRQEQASGAASASGSVSGPRDSSASASTAAIGAEDMRSVHGELQSKLYSKATKAGDQVLVRTTQKVVTSDGIEIPKGSRLVGHVTEVKAHEKGQAESHMGIAFDHAELKNGRSIPIHSAIQSIASPASPMASAGADDAFGGDMGAGPAAAGGRVAGGGGSILGGGRMGGPGLVGWAVHGVTSAGGNLGSDLDVSSGNATSATGRIAGNATGDVGGDLRGSANGVGSLAAHATGVPGVMLRGDATGSAAGMLSAKNKDIHLDSGTQLVLGVATSR